MPPLAAMVTTTVAAGHPTIIARTIDLQAGVDPLSLVFAYGDTLIGAVAYDPVSGYAVFPLPASAPPLKVGKTQSILLASDFQEDKNVDQAGEVDLDPPEHRLRPREAERREPPDGSWLFPSAGDCLAARPRLLVAAERDTADRAGPLLVGRHADRDRQARAAGPLRGDLEPQGSRPASTTSGQPSPTQPERRHGRRSASSLQEVAPSWTSASR